ncbi:MAG: hypothetical protein ACK5MN_10190 [Lachnospiraceae bacterium]
MFTKKERERLRQLANVQLEIANSEKNIIRTREWIDHNAMRGKRPMIHLEIDNFTQEILLPQMQCESPMARKIEERLLHNYFNMQVLDDDKVVAPYFGVWWELDMKPWGFDVKKEVADDGGLGQHFTEQVEELGEEMDKFKPSDFRIKLEETNQYFEAAQEAFGDILPVKRVGKSMTCWLTQDIVHIMGMQNMCYALYDYPDEFMQILHQLADDYMAFFRKWEADGLLYPTAGYEECNQGSICLTDELPSDGKVGLNQIWLHMDSQETINVSPVMFEEMIWDAYKKVADQFGMVSFGCCDPLERLWPSLSQLKNLRKASISPWTDEAYMGEVLKNTKTIYQRKPSPNYLGVSEKLDEEAWREHIATTLRYAKDCKVELTIRDVYTIHNDIDKAKRCVEIMKECIYDQW